MHAGCWREDSVSHHVGLSTGPVSVLITWQLTSPRATDPREQGGSCNVFYAIASEVTLIVTCHTVSSEISYWLHRSALLSVGGTTQGMNTRRQGSWGQSWRLATSCFNRKRVCQPFSLSLFPLPGVMTPIAILWLEGM